MTDDTPTYRLALKDSSHPFYEATWLIFDADMEPEYTAKRLADQKEALIPYFFEIVDDLSLREDGAPGYGFAPSNAIEILGVWRVAEAVPRMLEIFEHTDIDSDIHEATSDALKLMGSGIVDDLMKMRDRAADDLQFAIASILSEVGQGNQEVYDWVKTLFLAAKDYFDIHFYAEYMLDIDSAQAIPFLKEQIKHRKDKAGIKDVLENWMKEN